MSHFNQGFLFYKKKMESCTWLAHLDINLWTFLITKHFMYYDNVFLKDYSYS